MHKGLHMRWRCTNIGQLIMETFLCRDVICYAWLGLYLISVPRRVIRIASHFRIKVQPDNG